MNCPYCDERATGWANHIATACVPCNVAFLAVATIDEIKARGAWLASLHPDKWPDIRATWRKEWKR